MRRRFLLLSYFYPPHGGAGVQRALALSRLAPSHGWDPVVLASSQPGSTPIDRSLLEKVPEGVRVERTPAVLTDGIERALGRVKLRRLARALPVDRYLGWAPYAWPCARRLLDEERFDAIFSTSSPYTAHLLAERIKARTGLPWVLDLRDPWTDNEFLAVYRERDGVARFRQKVDRALERRAYAAADLVTVTAERLRELLILRHGLAPDKVHLVRNGFDADDFPTDAAPPARKDGVFRVLFGGSMYGDYNLAALFKAAERLLERRELPELELCLVSATLGWAEREGPRYPRLWPKVVLRKQVPHAEIVGLYRSADLLVLSSLDRLSVPGKLYEYIASGPAVLAFVVPGTDTEGLLARTGAGSTAPADDPARGAEALERVYDRWKAGERPARVAAEVARLTRQSQVEQMVGLFDRLVGA